MVDISFTGVEVPQYHADDSQPYVHGPAAIEENILQESETLNWYLNVVQLYSPELFEKQSKRYSDVTFSIAVVCVYLVPSKN